MEFDNSQDLRQGPPEVVKAKKEELLQLYNNIQRFVGQPPATEKSKAWVANELDTIDRLPIEKNGAEKTPHANSKAAQEAQRLGLQYYGFGRYGQNGEVTFRSVHDTLVKVVKQPTEKPMNKNVNEEFEDFLNEAKYITDKSGNKKVYTLRSYAASEAHKNKGVVYKHKQGYVIKLKESIDKGIEPGISMAGAGESPDRDMGEKIKKKTGKASQVAETIGAGGEMATSMSDQKENELKKKGISLASFKAKRVIG